MNRNATPAQKDVSTNPQIQFRIQKYAEDHPHAREYLIPDVIVASELLLAMAAITQLSARNQNDKAKRIEMKAVANEMRKAVGDGLPYQYLRSLGTLELHGLRIVLLEEVVEGARPLISKDDAEKQIREILDG